MTSLHIPLARPSFGAEEVEAVRQVLESGWVIQGPEVEAFEAALSELHNTKHCVAVSSGTAAIHLCYLALGIGPGDLVYLPSFAWPAAANVAILVGARPVLVDVLPGTYNIDPEDLERRIVESRKHSWGRPRLVVPVHQFGLAADMGDVLRVVEAHGIDVLEDAACALGATHGGIPVGGRGRAGVFSFHPRKAVSTGEGGAICTNDHAMADRCRSLRNHGQAGSGRTRDIALPGLNYRMTEIQAAIGRVQLTRLPRILIRRAQIASLYNSFLAHEAAVTLPEANPEHTWQTYMISVASPLVRQRVVDRLATQGIEVGPGSISAHVMSLYKRELHYRDDTLPVSCRLHQTGLALPMYEALSDSDTRIVAEQLVRALTL